jgi:hypothetical protein
MRLATIGAIVALVVLSPTRASAQDESSSVIGVLHVETEGVSETAAEMLEQSLEEGLAGVGFRIARSKRLKAALATTDYVDGCTFGPCLRAVHKATKMRLVLVARIRGVGSSYSFVVSLLDTVTGNVTSQVGDSCEVCTLNEAVNTATLAVISLVTGTGDAKVTNPEVGPTGTVDPGRDKAKITDLEARMASKRRSMRRGALFFAGAAVIAGAGGTFLLASGRDKTGYAALAGGGAFAVSSLTMLLVSRKF